MTASTTPTPDRRIGLSPPGGVADASEFQRGWRTGVADTWRAVQHELTADGCRQRIEAMGNGGMPHGREAR